MPARPKRRKDQRRKTVRREIDKIKHATGEMKETMLLGYGERVRLGIKARTRKEGAGMPTRSGDERRKADRRQSK